MKKLSRAKWLEMATQFILDETDPYDKVYLETRGWNKGHRTWVVYHRTSVLGKDGQWHYEPLPSSRDDKFLELTRFDTPDEAYHAWTNRSQNNQKEDNNDQTRNAHRTKRANRDVRRL